MIPIEYGDVGDIMGRDILNRLDPKPKDLVSETNKVERERHSRPPERVISFSLFAASFSRSLSSRILILSALRSG